MTWAVLRMWFLRTQFSLRSTSSFGTRSTCLPSKERRSFSIVDRLRQLAGLFGVEVCEYAVMSNHLHLVLRNRPDLVRGWSDAEVALRWRKILSRSSELS
jgi:hypothetical protein